MKDVIKNDALEQAEARLLSRPQVDCPLTNLFAPGIYWREIFIPANTFAIGHEHKTEHLNVLLSGHLRVLVDGKVIDLVAPQVFKSAAGVRKAAYALTDCRMANVHHNPTNETDQAKLEEIFVVKSDSHLNYHREMELLKP